MNMETLEEEEHHRLANKKKVNNRLLPSEIIEEIMSRLPVKSILRFTSVSKPWLSYISDPSFAKLRRIAFFISAFDSSTRNNYLFSATDHGEPLTLLMTLDDGYISEPQHLNGLVCFTFMYHAHTRFQTDAFLLNPSTHKFFKLPYPHSLMNYAKESCYYFGFDESRSEHKILTIRIRDLRARTAQIMIYSMSNYSWRTIDVEPPVGFSWDRLGNNTDASVCVNSVVYFGFHRGRNSFDILGFDLRTEKFSMISTPEGVVVRGFYRPRIIEINGSIGVVCYNYMEKSSEMYFWILQNGVWVREIITFPESWVKLAGPALGPLDVNMDELIFYKSKVSGSVMSMPIYDKKFRCFKSMQFNLGHQFPCSKTVRLDHIKFYVESMGPNILLNPCREKEDKGVASRVENNTEDVVTMKAKFGSDKIKFLLPIQEVSLAAINTEIQKRFECMGRYKVKYLDSKDEEWYLIAHDEDIQGHIKSLRSNKRVVEILIESTERSYSRPVNQQPTKKYTDLDPKNRVWG